MYKAIEWEILFLILYMWMTSHLLAVMSIYYWKQRNLCSQGFDLGEVHQDKRKGVLGLSQEAYLEKLQRNIVCMRVNLRLFPSSRVMDFGNFYVPRINMKWSK